MMPPPFALDRFLEAQDRVMPAVEAELTAGRKMTHWMWFVFPQIAGLGFSRTSRYYALNGREEAVAYLSDSILGTRLRRCVVMVCRHQGRGAVEIFGAIDALKFRSCLTLFLAVADVPEDRALFQRALDQFYEGLMDEQSLRLLAAGQARK